MPHLIFRGVEPETVRNASVALPRDLAKIAECPADYFTFFHEGGNYFVNGESVSEMPVIQILWFDRGQIVKNMLAQRVDKFMKDSGYVSTDIYFVALAANDYYENGKHF